MRTLLAATTLFWMDYSSAWATPADTTTMPQTDLPPAAPAEPVPSGPVFAFTATAALNYIFRGVSQTENSGSMFGAGRVSYDDFYAGIGI